MKLAPCQIAIYAALCAGQLGLGLRIGIAAEPERVGGAAELGVEHLGDRLQRATAVARIGLDRFAAPAEPQAAALAERRSNAVWKPRLRR